MVSRADRLRAVFDNVDSPRYRQRHQLLHGHGLAEQMDGDNRLGARRDFLCDCRRVEVERARINVGENDLCAHLVYRFRRRDVSEWRRDDFITRSNPQRAQRQRQRVGP